MLCTKGWVGTRAFDRQGIVEASSFCSRQHKWSQFWTVMYVESLRLCGVGCQPDCKAWPVPHPLSRGSLLHTCWWEDVHKTRHELGVPADWAGQWIDSPHLAVPSEKGKSSCSNQTSSYQKFIKQQHKFIKQQHIWLCSFNGAHDI